MNLEATAAQPNGMWPVVWKLLGLRLMIMLRSFRRSSRLRKIVWVLIGLMLTAFLGLIFYLSWSLLRLMRSPDLADFIGDIQPLLDTMPILILSGAFIGILFTSFGVLLQALYLAGDMDFLLSAPIPMRSVFVAKLLQAILPNFGLVCIFALPVLFGLGASSGYSFLYYPSVVIVLSALALAAAGIASLLVMGVVRIFPARRVAEVIGFIGAVASFICSQAGQIANLNEFNTEQTQEALLMLTRLSTPWSPLTWAGRGLVRIGEAEWLVGLGITTLTVSACVLIFGVALVASERLYFSGWANLRTVPRTKRAPRRPPTSSFSLHAGHLAQYLVSIPLLGVVQKDFLVLRRDMKNMSQLVTPLILGIIYFVMLLRGRNNFPNAAENGPIWIEEIFRSIALYSNVGLSLFVGWMLLGRLAGMGFAQEGKNYWVLKTAPISAFNLIAAKFLVAFLPTVALCWGFLLVTWLLQRPGFQILLFTIPVIALAISGNAGINLTFGILGANMNWEDPRQMQKGAAGCLNVLFSMIFLVLCLALFFGPAVLGAVFQLPAAIGQIVGLILGGVFSLVCAVLPLWLVRARVDRLGEN